MAVPTGSKAKAGAAIAALVAACVGGDMSGLTSIDWSELGRHWPYALAVVLYLELRVIPWAEPIRTAAQRMLGRTTAVDPLIAEAEDEIERSKAATRASSRKSTPLAVVTTANMARARGGTDSDS